MAALCCLTPAEEVGLEILSAVCDTVGLRRDFPATFLLQRLYIFAF